MREYVLCAHEVLPRPHHLGKLPGVCALKPGLCGLRREERFAKGYHLSNGQGLTTTVLLLTKLRDT